MLSRFVSCHFAFTYYLYLPQVSTYTVQPSLDTQFVRLDLLTLQLEVLSDNCVHDRLTIMGGKDM